MAGMGTGRPNNTNISYEPYRMVETQGKAAQIS